MKTISILGSAKSGLAAARLATARGITAFVSEGSHLSDDSAAATELRAIGVDYESGGHSSRLYDADCIVCSPGIPPHAPVLAGAAERSIEVISDVEFGYRLCRQPIAAITGTNGKTTTTALTAWILQSSGRKAVACGNIGYAFCDAVLDTDDDTILVAELSSYQLDRTSQFRARAAAYLNLTPDHLSWHGSLEAYHAAKAKIFANQTEEDTAVLNAHDARVRSVEGSLAGMRKYFGTHSINDGGLDTGLALELVDSGHRQPLADAHELQIQGSHNRANALAASLLARHFSISPHDIAAALRTFGAVEHRQEPVRTLHGVEYINDSKATNTDATFYALSSYSKPIVWIAGGRGDGNDYAPLDDLVRRHVKHIICIGEEAEALRLHFSGIQTCSAADGLDHAVHLARTLAQPGDVVLFSPACKSFDMFSGYEHRGKVFKDIVGAL